MTGSGGPAELFAFSQHRWTSPWQRSQQVLSRLARGRTLRFVEQPLALRELALPRLRHARDVDVERIWLEVPGEDGDVAFGDERARSYASLLHDRFGRGVDRAAWLDTPTALPLVDALGLPLLAYDVTGDAAATAASETERKRHELEALDRAAVVFTGSRTLHRAAAAHRVTDIFCFETVAASSGESPEAADWDTVAVRMAELVGAAHERWSRAVAGVGVIDLTASEQTAGALADSA